MQNVVNALLNLILVSIPEETFLTVMTLIFLKRFDLLDVRMWRQNLKWIMIPTLPVAILINLFRYIIIIPRPIMSLVCLILMMCLIIYIVAKSSFDSVDRKLVFRTVIFTFSSFIIVGLIELLYIPILLSLLHQPISMFNNNVCYNLLLTIPARVIQICIISYIVVRKNNSIQLNLFNTIVKNKFFTNSFIAIMILILTMIIYMAKLLIIDNILINLKVLDQVIIVLVTISTPIILITWFLMFVNYLLTKEKQIQQSYENLIIKDDVITDVES